MDEKNRELLLEDVLKNPEEREKSRLWKAFENYEKSPLWRKFENYRKNLLCLEDVAGRLLSNMKGQGVSFKPEITDRKGRFSQEKLTAFVDGLLSRWAAKQREGTFTDSSTGESMAEPYIRARQELYGCYLYLVMRCSLNKGDYALMTSSEMKVRTDFAFLLEQAKGISLSWCVMEWADGSKKNELFWGYDGEFGLHLYRVLSHPKAGIDNGFDLPGGLPVDYPQFLTDEGNVKRNQLKRIYVGHRPASLAKKAEEAEEELQPDEEDMAGNGAADEDGGDSEDGYDANGYDIEDGGDDEEDYDDNWGQWENYDDVYYEDEYDEAEERRVQKMVDIEYLVNFFEYPEEYVRKCKRFVELFRQAGSDVLRGFCEDLEEIVALYLAERDIPPVMDTDKALDVYSGIYDGPCRQAERYTRGIQWKNL